MKSNNNLTISSQLIFIVLSVFLIICFNYIHNYNNNYFKISYDSSWKKVESDKNHIELSKNLISTLEISGQNLDKEINNNNEIYNEINNNFKNSNETYRLVNKKDTTVGKEYYKAYELLYENDSSQVLYIVVIYNNKIINICYHSLISVFDIEIDNLYKVINTLEIR